MELTKRRPQLIQYFDELERVAEERVIKVSDICLVGSAVLAIYGIRDNRDVDIIIRPIMRENRRKERFSDHIECTMDEFMEIGVSDEEVFSKQKYTLVQGYKVARIEMVIAKKIIRGRKKDIMDVELVKNKMDCNICMEEIEGYLSYAKKWGWENGNGLQHDQFVGKLKSARDCGKRIYIYGAGDYGKATFELLKSENVDVDGFLVTTLENNEEELFCRPIEEARNRIDVDSLYVIATNPYYAAKIKKYLLENGINESRIISDYINLL